MMRETIVTGIRFLALCLLVGLVLAFFDIRPFEMFNHLGRTLRGIASFFSEFFDWAFPYIGRGAEVVVPVAVVIILLRWRGKPSR